jgi:hypothetical protein
VSEEENFSNEDLHFGKSDLGLLVFLSHLFSQGGGAARVRERGGEAARVDPYRSYGTFIVGRTKRANRMDSSHSNSRTCRPYSHDAIQVRL